MWEDISNAAGGRWLLQLPPAKNNAHIDDYWKNIVRTQLLFLIMKLRILLFQIMSIIGETYDQSNEINGVILNVRTKGTKIAVWTSNASKSNEDNILAIGYVINKLK